jgi:hypothetical protein
MLAQNLTLVSNLHPHFGELSNEYKDLHAKEHTSKYFLKQIFRFVMHVNEPELIQAPEGWLYVNYAGPIVA